MARVSSSRSTISGSGRYPSSMACSWVCSSAIWASMSARRRDGSPSSWVATRLRPAAIPAIDPPVATVSARRRRRTKASALRASSVSEQTFSASGPVPSDARCSHPSLAQLLMRASPDCSPSPTALRSRSSLATS
ncbi:Uncharacterised protein [Mycobacteroides abscessus subsp. abscessus]|nr:Uncharacterised protein [Mycobacteroides abscessus subsp. abscessus]